MSNLISFMNKIQEQNIIALEKNKDFLPVLLFLPDTQEWIDRYEKGISHLNENGIYPYCVAGVHGKSFGIQGTKRYMRDAWTRIKNKYRDGKIPSIMPEELKEQFYIGDNHTAGCISHYLLYNVMLALPYNHFLVLEDDCRFIEGWRERFGRALQDVPKDFDFLFVGSSDAENKEPVKISGDVWHFPNREGKEDWFPQTGFCYLLAKKALSLLVATQRTASENVDIQLIYEAFPYLNIYAILPRLANQEKTYLPK